MDKYIDFKKFGKILYYFTGGLTLWILLIVFAPIIKSSEVYLLKTISEYIYFFFEPVCHQIPERSILLNSEPMAVCTRCFAIYFGALILLITILIQKKIYCKNPSWMILILIPTALDFILEKSSLYVDIPIIRFITGLLFGVAILYLILYSILDIKNENLTKQEIYYGKSEIN